MSAKRPSIFSYQDYRKFLTDWLAFKKAGQPAFSLRALAKQAGLASGYLPMVLTEKRHLSNKAWSKIAPFLGMTAHELRFFENLLTLGSADSNAQRSRALGKMKRSSLFQKHNPREAEVYEYLTHWYYVVIREMATLPDFQEDPQWIQSRLQYPVPLNEISVAFDFLLRNGYLTRDKNGKIESPEKALDCSGEVFRVALGQYHRELLSLAAQSIDKTPSTAREILCHTVALSPEAFEQARKIAAEAIQKIQDLGLAETKGESVYHMEVALFPLTQRKGSSK